MNPQDRGAADAEVVAVVLSHNSRDTLRQCLTAVQSGTVTPRALIVVDNASDDGSPAMVRAEFPAVRLLPLVRNVGVGAGHNRGWACARQMPGTTAIWALEHDSIPTATCLELLLRARADAGPQVAAWLPRQAQAEAAVDDRRPDVRPARQFTFNGLLIEQRVIGVLGALREDFFVGMEDREYGERMGRAGFGVVRVLNAYVVHRNKGVAKRPGALSPARRYYAARNAARLRWESQPRGRAVLEECARTLGACARIAWQEPLPVAHVRARARAAADAVTGRMGERADVTARWTPAGLR